LDVERVDGAGAPMESASGIGLTSETKTSAVSPQHTNLKQMGDASTLAKDLLGVTLVPKTTVQSVPDVTSSPPVDQKVPIDSHLVPFGFGLDPPSNSASVDILIEASPNPLGYRVRSCNTQYVSDIIKGERKKLYIYIYFFFPLSICVLHLFTITCEHYIKKNKQQIIRDKLLNCASCWTLFCVHFVAIQKKIK
jgi:hypothetical protein